MKTQRPRHTPGPWQTFTYPDHVAVVFRHSNRAGTICDLTGVGGQHDANAQLIATAPDMLEALISVATVLNCVSEKFKEAPNTECDCYACAAARMVKNVIARAKA